MEEYITKGKIVLHPFKRTELEADLKALLVKKEKVYIVILSHLNNFGEWIVTGDYKGNMENTLNFMKPVASTEQGNFDVIFADWRYIIDKNLILQQDLTFNIKPAKFKPGRSIQTCSKCYCVFEASPTQPFCENCCNVLAKADLIRIPNKKLATFDEKFVRQIAHESWVQGLQEVSQLDFNHWLNKILDNGNNNAKKRTAGRNDKPDDSDLS